MNTLFYTEYLPRLGSVSVCLQKPSKFSSVQDVVIDRDNNIVFKLEGISDSIVIPLSYKVHNHSNLIHTVKVTEDCFSLRIHADLSDISKVNLSGSNGFMNLNAETRWSAKYIKNLNECTFSCQNCGSAILHSKSLSNIHDMPSELWAEMMEFWHCHKPDDGHDHPNQMAKYSSITPQVNSLVVGSFYVLLNKGNDFQLEVTLNDFELTASCKNCGFNLGVIENNGTVKIFKWNLKLKYNNTIEGFQPYVHAFNSILDVINSSAMRTIVIESEKGDSKINIWVFNVGLSFSLNVDSEYKCFENCMKVMYSYDNLANLKHSSSKNDVETITLPDLVYNDFIAILSLTNRNLPTDYKKMNNWNIGFLPCE